MKPEIPRASSVHPHDNAQLKYLLSFIMLTESEKSSIVTVDLHIMLTKCFTWNGWEESLNGVKRYIRIGKVECSNPTGSSSGLTGATLLINPRFNLVFHLRFLFPFGDEVSFLISLLRHLLITVFPNLP